jgi:hypothetical protein
MTGQIYLHECPKFRGKRTQDLEFLLQIQVMEVSANLKVLESEYNCHRKIDAAFLVPVVINQVTGELR